MCHIINLLRQFTSTLQKQDLLLDYTTPIEEKLFKWAYDPFKTYGLHFDYIDMSNLGVPSEDMFILLSKLASKELSGNNARYEVEKFAQLNGNLIKLVCNKDLDCGVSTVTLNNTFGKGFIPSFDIQLAREEDINKVKFPLYAQIKYNGARVIAIVEDSIVTFKSRGGHEFSFPKLGNFLSSLPNCVLDGELTFGDSRNENHAKVSGLVNSAIKGTPITNLELVYNIFDTMSISEFNRQDCKVPYKKRLEKVAEFVTYLTGNLTNKAIVALATTIIVENKEATIALYESLLSKGYEGLILKGIDSQYTFKKNKTWIKMKAEETADLLCIDYVEGKNKYEGQIGSLTCRGLVQNKLVQVDVGGLTDSDRLLSPHYFIGKTIEVKYNTIIANKKNPSMYSLFLPRFVCVRKDKS